LFLCFDEELLKKYSLEKMKLLLELPMILKSYLNYKDMLTKYGMDEDL
jgi:hypothetical protein